MRRFRVVVSNGKRWKIYRILADTDDSASAGVLSHHHALGLFKCDRSKSIEAKKYERGYRFAPRLEAEGDEGYMFLRESLPDFEGGVPIWCKVEA